MDTENRRSIRSYNGAMISYLSFRLWVDANTTATLTVKWGQIVDPCLRFGTTLKCLRLRTLATTRFMRSFPIVGVVESGSQVKHFVVSCFGQFLAKNSD